jgi:hypothetical protein
MLAKSGTSHPIFLPMLPEVRVDFFTPPPPQSVWIPLSKMQHTKSRHLGTHILILQRGKKIPKIVKFLFHAMIMQATVAQNEPYLNN